MIDAAAAGTDQGAGAERARIAAILRSPEAEARIATAIALALDTDLSAGEAVKVLTVCPKGVAFEEPTAVDAAAGGGHAATIH